MKLNIIFYFIFCNASILFDILLRIGAYYIGGHKFRGLGDVCDLSGYNIVNFMFNLLNSLVFYSATDHYIDFIISLGIRRRGYAKKLRYFLFAIKAASSVILICSIFLTLLGKLTPIKIFLSVFYIIATLVHSTSLLFLQRAKTGKITKGVFIISVIPITLSVMIFVFSFVLLIEKGKKITSPISFLFMIIYYYNTFKALFVETIAQSNEIPKYEEIREMGHKTKKKSIFDDEY